MLTLNIPFDQFPYVQGHLTLEPRNCEDCSSISLPELSSHLQPGPVTRIDLGQGDYRLEGNHLKAVQKVRLSRAAIANDFDATPGLNNLEFSLKQKSDRKLDAGTWNVFLLIGKVPIPAMYLDDQQKLQQLVLVIPTETKPALAVGADKK